MAGLETVSEAAGGQVAGPESGPESVSEPELATEPGSDLATAPASASPR